MQNDRNKILISIKDLIKHPWKAGIFLSVISILAYFILSNFIFHWTKWAYLPGFEGYIDPTGVFHPGKTIWDLAEMVIVPIALAIAAWTINHSEKNTEQRIATDRNQTELLQSYFEKMSELLLDKKLRESNENDEIRSVARALTLSVLRNLNGERKGMLLKFLYDSRLINKNNPVLNLQGSDFRGAILEKSFLVEANLEMVDFEGANFREANLMGTILNGANLNKSNFNRSILMGASFCTVDMGAFSTDREMMSCNSYCTHLVKADLREALISKANLSGADLSYATFEKAFLFETNLKLACVKGTKFTGAIMAGSIMPDGEEYSLDKHENINVKNN